MPPGSCGGPQGRWSDVGMPRHRARGRASCAAPAGSGPRMTVPPRLEDERTKFAHLGRGCGEDGQDTRTRSRSGSRPRPSPRRRPRSSRRARAGGGDAGATAGGRGRRPRPAPVGRHVLLLVLWASSTPGSGPLRCAVVRGVAGVARATWSSAPPLSGTGGAGDSAHPALDTAMRDGDVVLRKARVLASTCATQRRRFVNLAAVTPAGRLGVRRPWSRTPRTTRPRSPAASRKTFGELAYEPTDGHDHRPAPPEAAGAVCTMIDRTSHCARPRARRWPAGGRCTVSAVTSGRDGRRRGGGQRTAGRQPPSPTQPASTAVTSLLPDAFVSSWSTDTRPTHRLQPNDDSDPTAAAGPRRSPTGRAHPAARQQLLAVRPRRPYRTAARRDRQPPKALRHPQPGARADRLWS